jgi:hypothetical protein
MNGNNSRSLPPHAPTPGEPIMSKIPIIKLKSCEPDHLRILHLSDLHFGPKTDYSTGLCFQMEARLRTELGNPPALDAVFVTGDLVDNRDVIQSQTAYKEALQRVKTYLKRFCAEWCKAGYKALVVVPGNHDYRLFGCFPGPQATEEEFRKQFHANFGHRVLQFTNAKIILPIACFDSNFRHSWRKLDLARGQVDPDEAPRFQSAVSALRFDGEVVRIALVHHHPLPVARAETQKLTSFLDKLFGKRTVGAEEYMLLRNSGTFLHQLLGCNFRLVLHGHMHESGYWRVRTTTQEHADKWIEVVAGGSAGAPDSSHHNFNLLRIYRDGYVQGAQFGYDETGHQETPVTIPFTPYELVRTRNFDAECKKAQAVCDKLTITYNIHLEKGDTEITESYRDLRASKGELDHLSFHGHSDALTRTEFKAIWRRGTSRITNTRQRKSSTAPNTIEYEVDLAPPLNTADTMDLDVTYRLRGIMYRSEQDQQYLMPHKTPEGWDNVAKQLRLIHARQLMLNLRFFWDHTAKHLPEDVLFEVQDNDGHPSSHEANGCHASFEYLPATSSNQGNSNRGISANTSQAVLTVHNPLLFFTYMLKWRLHDLPHASQLDEKRLNFFTHIDQGETYRQTAYTLLQELVQELRQFHRGRWHMDLQQDLAGYLFSFNQKTTHLKCCTSVDTKDPDPLRSTPIGYGKDIVGTAFRRGEPVAYSLSKDPSAKRGLDIFQKIHGGYHFLIAIPLQCPNFPTETVAVFVAASQSPASGLRRIVEEKNALKALAYKLAPVWNRFCTKLCETCKLHPRFQNFAAGRRAAPSNGTRGKDGPEKAEHQP